MDDNGRTMLHSGAVADGGKGPVEPGAHFYRSLLLDEHGNPINKRNAWAARSVAYVRLIPPGAADTIHYRLQIPAGRRRHDHLKAKVNYRKFAWWNTQWAFAGVRDPAAEGVFARAGSRRRAVGVHGGHVEGLGPDEGDPGHPDDRHGRGQATLQVIAGRAPPCRRRSR